MFLLGHGFFCILAQLPIFIARLDRNQVTLPDYEAIAKRENSLATAS
jgi:hypothetical protein